MGKVGEYGTGMFRFDDLPHQSQKQPWADLHLILESGEKIPQNVTFVLFLILTLLYLEI